MPSHIHSAALGAAANLEAAHGQAAGRQRLKVGPVEGGWRVRHPATEDLMFLSGGQAEQCARMTALRLARHGLDVEVRIHDRFDHLAGTIHYFAEDGGDLSKEF